MVAICLLTSTATLAFFNYFLFHKDLMNPSFATCATFVLATLWCMYAMYLWDWELQWETYGIIISNLLVNTVVYWVFLGPKSGVKQKTNLQERRNPRLIHVNLSIVLAYYSVAIITIVLYFVWLRNIGRQLSIDDWATFMASIRESSLTYGVNYNAPFIIRQLLSAVVMSGYIVIYILIHNYFINKSINLFLLSYVALTAIGSLLQGYRGDLMRMFIATVVIFYFVWRNHNGWERTVPFKFIMGLLLFLIAVLVVFSLVRGLVGRLNPLDMIPYIAQYFGGSTILFDMYLQAPAPHNGIIGIELFPRLYRTLGELLGKPEWIPYVMEFRATSVRGIGNAYSAYRHYYHDFGFVGTLVLSSLSSVIFSVFYKACRNISKSASSKVFVLILYSYISFTVFLQFYSSNIYMDIIGYPKEIFKIAVLFAHYCVFFLLKPAKHYEHTLTTSRYIKHRKAVNSD